MTERRQHERRQHEPRRVDEPKVGCFRIKLVRAGPWVAAEIRRCDAGRWQAWIDGKALHPSHADPALAGDVFAVWHYGEMITRSEHDFLVKAARWARAHAPDRPEANPRRAIRVGSLPPIF